MKGMDTCAQNKGTGNFTPGKFLFTGREILVELRASLHTFRGKFGFALLLFGIAVGFYGVLQGAEDRRKLADQLISSLCWSNIGLIIMINFQNHRLIYLLPISRKEFAAMQIRKMLWVAMFLLLLTSAELACAGQETERFWWDFFARVIPVSMALSSSQIAAVQPVKGSERNGTKLYGLSIMVLCLDVGAAFFNLLSTGDFWSIPGCLLPAVNYLTGLFAIGYFYRKIVCADLYYDEL